MTLPKSVNLFACAICSIAITGCGLTSKKNQKNSASSTNDAETKAAVLTGNGEIVHELQLPITESKPAESIITLSNPSVFALVDVSGYFSDPSMIFAGGIFPGTGGTCGKSIPAGSSCKLVVVYDSSSLLKSISLGAVPAGAPVSVQLVMQYLQSGIKKSNILAFNINVDRSLVNKPPVANDISGSTKKDEKVKINLIASDPEGKELIFDIIDNPEHGVIKGEGKQYEYTPNFKYYGQDRFTYKVNDGQMDSNLATVTIQVTGENEPPVAKPAEFSLLEDSELIGTLEGSDPESNPIEFKISTAANKGQIEILNANTGEFKYTPNSNANGQDQFSFQVYDREGISFPEVVTLNITPMDDAPVMKSNIFSVNTNEDTRKYVRLNDTASDADGDALYYVIELQPAHGKLSNGPFGVGYTPDANFFGTDSFTYKVGDGKYFSSSATVQITIEPVNDLPSLGLTTLATNGNKAIKYPLDISDVDGDSVTATICTDGVKGTAIIDGSDVIYTPNNDQIGGDSIAVCLTDGKGNSEFSIQINISAVDSTFGNGGSINLPRTLTSKHRFTLLENGKILLALGMDNQTSRILSVRQYLEDGEFDHSFGNQGQVDYPADSSEADLFSAISNRAGDIFAVGTDGSSGIVLKIPVDQNVASAHPQTSVGEIFFPSFLNDTYLLAQTRTEIVGGDLADGLTNKIASLVPATSSTSAYVPLSNNQYAVATLHLDSSNPVSNSLSVSRYQVSNQASSLVQTDQLDDYRVPNSAAFVETTPPTLLVDFKQAHYVAYCVQYSYVGGQPICGGNGGCYYPQYCSRQAYRKELTGETGFYTASTIDSTVKVTNVVPGKLTSGIKLARNASDGIYLISGNTMYRFIDGEIQVSWNLDSENIVDFAIDSRGRILVLKQNGTLTRYLRPASSLVPVNTPGAPTSVTGKDGVEQVYLTWKSPTTNGGAWITSYEIQYSSDNGSSWSTVASVPPNSASANITGLTPGTAYVFRVAAKNPAGTGLYSQESPSVTPRYPPSWSDVTIGSDITIRDNLTNIWWSKSFGAGFNDCAKLYNGQGGWRRPSIVELIQASKNGISTQGKDGWITAFNRHFQSSSGENDYYWFVNLESGSAVYEYYYYRRHSGLVCVRQP